MEKDFDKLKTLLKLRELSNKESLKIENRGRLEFDDYSINFFLYLISSKIKKIKFSF